MSEQTQQAARAVKYCLGKGLMTPRELTEAKRQGRLKELAARAVYRMQRHGETARQ